MAKPVHDCSWVQRTAFGCVGRFDFSLRFEHIILSIVPSTIFLLATFWRVFRLSRLSKKTQKTGLRLVKLCIAVTYAATQIALLSLWSSDADHGPASIAASTLSFVLAVGLAGLALLEHDRSVRPSSLIMTYLMLSSLFDAAQLRTLILVHKTALSVTLGTAILCKLTLLVLEAKSKSRLLDGAYRLLPPEAVSGIISRSLFWWTHPLFKHGYRRLLSPTDIYAVDLSMSSAALGARLNEIIAHSDMCKSHAFLRACLQCLWKDILLMAPARLAVIGFTYSQTFLLTGAVNLLSKPSSHNTRVTGYALIGATFLIYTGIAISTALYQRRAGRVMVKLRGAIVASVFRRALLTADGTDTERSAITLMSTDVDSILRVFSELNEAWARLTEVVIGIALLSRQVGVISVVPVVLAVLSTQAQTWVSKRIGNRRKLWSESTQKRVGTTAAVLGSISSVRVSGLMSTTAEYLQTLRVTELGYASAFLKFVVGLNAIAIIPSIWAPVLTWITYAVKARVEHDDHIDTTQAFTSLALLSLITTPTAKLLTIMPLWAQASACFDRLQQYFNLPIYTDNRDRFALNQDMNGPVVKVQDEGDIALSTLSPTPGCAAITLQNVTIPKLGSHDPLLAEVWLEAARGTITAIIGPPGSGKTTLLKALLGEVVPTAGRISLSSKSVAYCAQTPWITDSTIVDFITGPDGVVNLWWYRQVIQACDLAEDLQHQPEGDDTRIGSRGIALSGGQRARLALARAVYARRNILLLDDILSAVDTRTESKIVSSLTAADSPFRREERTIVAITHSAKLLAVADKVYRLTDGKLTAVDRALGSHLAITDHAQPSKHLGNHDMQPSKAVQQLTKPLSPEEKQDLSRQTGDWSVYRYYFRNIKWSSLLLFALCSVCIAFCSSFTQVWLQWWTDSNSSNNTLYLTLFAVLALGSMFFTSANMVVVFLNIMPSAAAKLHQTLVESLQSAPYALFFNLDTGTILNRFSQDMSLVCNALSTSLISTGNTLCETLASLALISLGASYMGLAIPFVLVAVFLVQKIYLRTSRQLRYLDLERRSPLYSHFLETLEGVVTIRCLGWSAHYEEANCQRLDSSQAPLYLLYSVQRWLRLVLDLTTAGMAVVVVALALSLRESTSPGRLGLALTNILTFSQSLSRLVNEWTTMETSIGSVSRIRSFELKFRGAAQDDGNPIHTTSLGTSSPSAGSITFSRVRAMYDTTDIRDRLCLNDVNFEIRPGQKVSVCGRTGSGKTSLMLALFGLLPLAAGEITVDGVDLSTIAQEDLQKHLIGVPQQAFIMPASVRYNLDPSRNLSDERLLEVLSKVALQSAVERLGGLDASLDQSSFSQGQQQLFCLARALCRKRKGTIVVLDEPTSNLDPETHRMVAELITREFRDCTVVTIAHRVDTIMSSDVVIFMDQARLAGFGPPEELAKENRAFRELCQQ